MKCIESIALQTLPEEQVQGSGLISIVTSLDGSQPVNTLKKTNPRESLQLMITKQLT